MAETPPTPEILSSSGLPVSIATLVEGKSVAYYVGPYLGWLAGVRELSPNTVAAYRNALAAFVEFCEAYGIQTPAAGKDPGR